MDHHFTRQDLFDLHRELCNKGYDILRKKNADYSKTHPLGNFFVAEAMQSSTAENGIITRIGDKLSRLVSVLEKGSQVKDESVDDNVVDIINYAVLLMAVIQYKRMGGHAELQKKSNK